MEISQIEPHSSLQPLPTNPPQIVRMEGASFPLPSAYQHLQRVSWNDTVVNLNSSIVNLPISLLTPLDEKNLLILQGAMDEFPMASKSEVVARACKNLIVVKKNDRIGYCDGLVQRVAKLYQDNPNQLKKQFEIVDRLNKRNSPQPPVDTRLKVSFLLNPLLENSAQQTTFCTSSHSPDSSSTNNENVNKSHLPISRSSSSPVPITFCPFTEDDYYKRRPNTTRQDGFKFHEVTAEQYKPKH